jgi:phosphosulfolactate synthase (CoM biosynthesis protein A)
MNLNGHRRLDDKTARKKKNHASRRDISFFPGDTLSRRGIGRDAGDGYISSCRPKRMPISPPVISASMSGWPGLS